MAFLDDVWVASSYNGHLYKLENDIVVNDIAFANCEKYEPCAVHVCQDRITVYVANTKSNTVSKFVSGNYICDIDVGNQPRGITEDSYGAIYVTCYKDAMVYKIEEDASENSTVTAKIQVDAGPIGITCDSDNTLWVACSIANTVVRVVGNTAVSPSIAMGDSSSTPTGITCDKNDNIWVTNYGTNVISKINRSRKVLDKDLGTDKGPMAIVCDKDFNIWVANYIGDTITKVSGVDGSITEIQLPTGSGASAIDINSEGDVYVVCTLNHELIKIHNDIIVATIPVATNNVGFGDFTGMAMYNVFGEQTSTSLTVDEAAIQLMKNLTLSMKVTQLVENVSSTTIHFSSDIVNLDAFDHIKIDDGTNTLLATKVGLNAYVVTIPMAAASITILKFVGYYDSTDNLRAEFNDIDFTQVYNVIAGTLQDDGTGTGAYIFVPAKTHIKIVNPDDLSTAFVVDPDADGNNVILLSNRVVAADVAKGITINGMPISPNWEIATGSDTEALAQSAISTQYPNHTIFMDPNPSYKDNPVLLVRYKL